MDATSMAKVALGGTFDPIHDGHRKLFHAAFDRGDVTVGLTSDGLARRIRPDGRPIRTFDKRKTELAAELRGIATEYDREFIIRKLHSPLGIADIPKFDVLVVSPETEGAARRINELREGRGIPPLEVVVVDHVLAEDNEIISSTRILRGEIDGHGVVLDGK